MKRQAWHMCLLTMFLAPALAAEQSGPVRWEREAAVAASVHSDTSDDRLSLLASLKSGSGEDMLATLRRIQSSANLSAPARERLIFEFVQDLRQEPPGSVPPKVVAFLKRYPVTVMVEHHDHPYADEALYNIPTAMFGVVNHWTRQQAAFDGAALLSTDASALVRAYLDTDDPARQRGLIDAVSTADANTVRELSRVALDEIDQQPSLTALAGHAALRSGDLALLNSVVSQGGGPGLNEVLRISATQLDAVQQEQLLQSVLNSGRPGNAALAIAHLGPAVRDGEHMLQALIGQLSDPHLGSSAALALSRNPSPALRRALTEIGRHEQAAVAASRARLALQLMQDFPEQEAPR